MVSGSLFTLLFGVLFTFPSRYWSTIGLSGVFSLTGWCRQIQTGRLRPRPTQDTTSHIRLPLRGSHPLWPAFPYSSGRHQFLIVWSYNPRQALTWRVWALARSLATTGAITVVFFSSGYLDVSVPRVCPPPCSGVSRLHLDGLPHSDTRGSNPICGSPRIFAAYRVLLRL